MTNLADNPVLEAYYAKMNGREEEHRLSEYEAGQEREWATFRDRFVDEAATAFEAAKNGEADSIGSALGTLAGYFYNPNGNVTGRAKDGDEGIPNALEFQLRGMLGNLVQNAKWMRDNAHQHREKLIAEVDQCEATCGGTEIGLRKLSYAIDKLEDAQNVQLPACQEWFEVSKAAYEAIIGDEWKPYAKKGKSQAEQSADAVRARLEKLRAG